MILKIKPLSVNAAWQGKRYKSPVYKKYCKVLPWMMKDKIPWLTQVKEIYVYYKFCFSSKQSDWDNPIKPFQDILAKHYGFNDSYIYGAYTEKCIVQKGKESIEVRFFQTKEDLLNYVKNIYEYGN